MSARIAAPLAWRVCAVSAALFNPVRRRVQEPVDRRLNRSRYDARRTIEAFGTHLRDETELSALSAYLITVAARTMQPESIAVWLREEA